VRGFHEKSPAARELLETIGQSFLAGYAYAAEARTPADAEERLEGVPAQFRGFAYEGAAMAFAVRDGLPLGRGRNVATFLAGRAANHVYMVYVGVGWAMARLPRFRWSRLYAPDPLLRWLALDGYGFHQAYFHTDRYVHGQYREPRFPWPADGPRWYADRAIDQGIGRAMWFVGGADADRVATMIDKFAAHRRADLYSGAGLAATYAGGADADELLSFRQRAGEHGGQVAQASVFAATARVRAGLVTDHTRVATRALCGLTPEAVAQISDDLRPAAPGRLIPGRLAAPGRETGIPAYEVWRQRLADQFVSLGRS